MYEDIASARFFRAKSTGINSFRELVREGDWVIADIDGQLYQLVLGGENGEQDVLDRHATEVRDALCAGRAFGAGELHCLVESPMPCDATPKPIDGEQSNTSIIFDSVMMKFFRQLEPGVNPDVELLEALANQRCQYVPPLRAYTTLELAGEHYVTSMLQDFVPDAEEGWSRALDFARRDESFAQEAQLLGEAVREVHRDLAEECGTQEVDNRHLIQGLSERVDTLVQQAPVLADYVHGVQAVYDKASEGTSEIQRIHGDLHLGQTLRSADGYLLIDFEGEPARPLAERRAMSSPLQDVAGMLRSFDYAAHFEGDHDIHADDAFLEAYGVQRSPLLDAYVLDKALYEVAYEANNRPDWVSLPLAAVQRLTQGGIS